MIEVPREKRLTALIAVLRTMTGTRPGFDGQYPNEIQVDRGQKDGEAVHHRPSLLVAEGSGSTVRIEVTVGGAVGVFHVFNVLVIGYVKGTPDATAATWLQNLWDDLMTTLYANDTLGGMISRLEYGDLVTDEGMLDPQAEFVQPLTMRFSESKQLQVTP